MTYQEVNDRLTRVQTALQSLQDGSYANQTSINVPQITSQLQEAEAKLKEQLLVLSEAEKTAFINGQPAEYTQEKELEKFKNNPDVTSIKTAAGKKLKEQEGPQFNLDETKAIAREIGKDYKNNIGEVLQAWTYRSFIKDDDKVLFVEGEVEFVDFLNAQECLILKQTLLFKYITELGLKRIFSDGFDARFKSALRRLINTKILLRSPKGELFINPVVLMDINEILKKRKI